ALNQWLAALPPAPVLQSVRSRKSHGAAGTFDVVVDAAQPIGGAVSVDPRALGAGHTIVFSFASATGAAGTGTALHGVGNAVGAAGVGWGNDVVVSLPAVQDNKRVSITLANVNGSGGGASASLGFLVGDADASRTVTSGDVDAVKGWAGSDTTAANFRHD